MMFVKFSLYGTEQKIIINIENIIAVWDKEENKGAVVTVRDGSRYHVNETTEFLTRIIDGSDSFSQN